MNRKRMQNTKNSITQSGFKRNLGQFFSPKILVKQCISLIQNKKRGSSGISRIWR
ncbi:hypothetical protein [Helicobacter rodentium]|uniref:hypothetical protein n=1 Tax=Helicobacter rodentium TaxID=59617 RepID=UPI003F4AF212